MRRVLVSLVALAVASSASAATDQKCFPDTFLFGAATASYQVEGGWNATGRTPSVWDDYCRAVPTLECANVADDFVHRYKADIDLMVETGLSSFRFSVSWSRAMNWDAATQRMAPNAPGLAFYHDVIDTLRAKGIAPILTLYHWDLPRELQQNLSPQGWLNPALGDHFQQYAELLFTEFGTKVTYWSTFNEPHSFITAGYSFGSGPPALPPSATNAYVVAHNVLVAHGKAVQSFRAFQAAKKVLPDAKIGMVLNTDYSYPLDPSNAADVAAAERRTEFFFGWFLEPLVSGEYPAIMRERVGDRLPVFTPQEQALVKASYDVLMLNHYGSKNIVDCASPQSSVECASQTLGWEADLGIDDSHMPDGARHASTAPNGEYLCKWFSAYPQGYLDSIRWLHKHDPSAPILLTENGWCGNATIDNQDQLWYFQNYLEQVHTALTADKIPIIGYTAWSFVDNYEWGSFKPRFGLYYVNFTADTGCKNGYEPKATDLARIPRTAAKWYARVAKTKCLGEDKPTAVAMVGDRDGVSPLSFLTRGSMVLVPVAALTAMAVLVLRQRRRRRPATAGETAPLLRP